VGKTRAPGQTGMFDVPPYTIMSTIPRPGLKVDYEKREISFDWRRMYSVFFREAEHMKRLWAPLASLVPGSWYTLGLLLIILLHFRRKIVKLFTGKYVVFESGNGTRITSVGITWMICLMRVRRNVPEIWLLLHVALFGMNLEITGRRKMIQKVEGKKRKEI
jgi:hypothetical protein